ncbi:MAG TPA: hypothetical protein VFJ58_17970, partial [Armatimonadota bacterium]|nr:hypothetical protein [Armatimonadota bacterium]
MMNRVRYSFRFILAVLLATLIGVAGRPAPASAQAPANDNIANAIFIGAGCNSQPGSVTGTNIKATLETGEPRVPLASGFSIWYTWVPNNSGATTFLASAGNFNVTIGIYTDSANPATVAALTPVTATTGSEGQVQFKAAAGTQYFIQLDSARSAITGSITLSWSQLNAPSGLTAAAGNTTVQLRWRAPTSPVDGCTGNPTWTYDILRATDGGGFQLLAMNIPGSQQNYTDTLLTNSQRYTYVVIADDGVLLTFSNIISATPLLPTPTGVKAFPGEKQVSLQWNVVPHALSYNVKRSASSGGPYTTIANVTTNSYTDLPLTDGVTYYYVVSAVDVSSESGNSAEVSATPEPPGPSDLVASVNEGEVILNWSATPGATSYNVKRGTVTGGPYTTISSGQNATTYTDSGVINGNTYYYVVTSNYSTGESPNSNEVKVDVPTLDAPQNLTAVGGNMVVDLTWDASAEAASYSVKRGTASGGPYTTISAGQSNTSFHDT